MTSRCDRACRRTTADRLAIEAPRRMQGLRPLPRDSTSFAQYRWPVADNVVMGVDIGGTGIKGAPVDVEKGELAGERFRILTPHPATPKAVADVVAEVVEHFDWKGPVGATFPAVVKDGITLSAANVDKEWIGAQ